MKSLKSRLKEIEEREQADRKKEEKERKRQQREEMAEAAEQGFLGPRDEYVESELKGILKKAEARPTSTSPSPREEVLRAREKMREEARKRREERVKTARQPKGRPTTKKIGDIPLSTLFPQYQTTFIPRATGPRTKPTLVRKKDVIFSLGRELEKPVTDDVRREVRSQLEAHFLRLLPPGEAPSTPEPEIPSLSPEEQRLAAEPIRPWKAVEKVGWDRARHAYVVRFYPETGKIHEELFHSALVPEERLKAKKKAKKHAGKSYYDKRLYNWIYDRVRPELLEKAPDYTDTATALHKLQKTPDLSVQETRDELTEAWIRNEFDPKKYVAEYAEEFNDRYYDQLYEEYLDYVQKHLDARAKAAEIRRLKQEARQKRDVPRSDVYKEGIRKYEECVFEQVGDGSTEKYLESVLFPLVFLSPFLQSYTKMFQATLPRNMSSLCSWVFDEGRLAYFFPEFSMNIEKLSPKTVEMAEKELGSILTETISDVVKAYFFTLHPGLVLREPPSPFRVFNWAKVTTPVKQKCQTDTGTGEGIPLSDIVLCRDPKTGLYSCQSVLRVLRIIYRNPSNPVNPSTGRPYEESFVRRMKARYPEMLADEELMAMPAPVEARPPAKALPVPPVKTLPPAPVKPKTAVERKVEKLFEDEDDEPQTLSDLKKVMPKGSSLAVLYIYWDADPDEEKTEKMDAAWEKIKSDHPDLTFIETSEDGSEELRKSLSIRRYPLFQLLRKKNRTISRVTSTSDPSKLERLVNKHK